MPGSRILIIDDEKVFADTLARIFTHVGYETRAVYSAEQALELLENWEPALVVVDVVLPRMNGIDFAIALKSNHPAVVVMMISGQLATSSLVEDAAKSGYQFDILAKPVPVPELIAGASKLLGSSDAVPA